MKKVAHEATLSFQNRSYSERKAYSCLYGARSYKVRSAKGRFKVVQRDLVSQVYEGQPRSQLYLVRPKDVVTAKSEIEQVSRSDARRIGEIIFRAVGGNPKERCTASSRVARTYGRSKRRKHITAEQPDLLLFVGSKAKSRLKVRNRTRNESAVIPPCKRDERRELMDGLEGIERVLHLSRLLELLIMVDQEGP